MKNSRRGKPWWLVLLLAAFGYIYKTYIEAPTRNSSTNTTREYSPEKKPRTPTQPKTAPSMKMEGGVMLSDTVVKVSDGDTVKLQKLGSVRLIGVDCPELHYKGTAQPGGEEAGEFARRALLNQEVRVQLCEKQPYDRYGRGLAFIYLRDRNGNWVLFNRELVRAGYARVYSLRPCTIDETEWNALYEEARRARRGLFATLGDVPDAAAFRRAGR
jgi:endonuclease YncB( thermonuclease family)